MFTSRGYLHPFLNGRTYLYGVGELPRTLTELAMCKLSARIRETDEWWLRMHERSFRNKWTSEGVNSTFTIRTSSGVVDVQVSSKQVKYVLDELTGYATLRDLKNNCEVSSFDRIWKTSTELPRELLEALINDTATLQTNPGTVLRTYVDVVDPCKHALVYGHTLQHSSDGSLSPIPLPETWYYAYSTRFAYLPTIFSIPPVTDPCRVTAQGYITGIPPSMPTMYRHIESVLSHTIPLLEHVLTDLHRNNPMCHRIPGACKYERWDEPDEPEHSDDEEGWAEYQREMRHWSLHRPIVQPDVPVEGYQGGLDLRRDQVSLRGSKVKVVTRMMEVRLFPDRPLLPPTPWHAEGMVNEHIVACAMLCVASHNMKPLNMNFRMAVQAPRNFLPGDVGATKRTWGMQDGAPSHQHLGSSALEPGKVIAYPNIYQSQLSGTHLLDPSKPGCITLLAFYFVDPDFPGLESERDLPTTSTVPPQDISWIRRALEDYIDIKVPTEIIDKIVEHVDWLLPENEYQECAQKMRTEREAFWHTHDMHWFSVPFSVWQA